MTTEEIRRLHHLSKRANSLDNERANVELATENVDEITIVLGANGVEIEISRKLMPTAFDALRLGVLGIVAITREAIDRELTVIQAELRNGAGPTLVSELAESLENVAKAYEKRLVALGYGPVAIATGFVGKARELLAKAKGGAA